MESTKYIGMAVHRLPEKAGDAVAASATPATSIAVPATVPT
jgi:hypothetical protein